MLNPPLLFPSAPVTEAVTRPSVINDGRVTASVTGALGNSNGGLSMTSSPAASSVLFCNASQTVGSLSSTSNGGSVNVNLNGTAVTFTIGGSASTTYDGTITGTGVLEEGGTGTLTLTGVNTHAHTQIDGGTVAISADSALGISSVSV